MRDRLYILMLQLTETYCMVTLQISLRSLTVNAAPPLSRSNCLKTAKLRRLPPDIIYLPE